MPLVAARAVPAARIDTHRRVLVGVDECQHRVQRIGVVRAHDDADLVAIRADHAAQREERDRVDERLDEVRVELLPGETRQDEARVLGRRWILIRPRAGDGLVDVGDRHDLAHEVRHEVADVRISVHRSRPDDARVPRPA